MLVAMAGIHKMLVSKQRRLSRSAFLNQFDLGLLCLGLSGRRLVYSKTCVKQPLKIGQNNDKW